MASSVAASKTEKRDSIDKEELESPTLFSSVETKDVEKQDAPVHYSFPRKVGRYDHSQLC